MPPFRRGRVCLRLEKSCIGYHAIKHIPILEGRAIVDGVEIVARDRDEEMEDYINDQLKLIK
jgi:hypothetical protein